MCTQSNDKIHSRDCVYCFETSIEIVRVGFLFLCCNYCYVWWICVKLLHIALRCARTIVMKKEYIGIKFYSSYRCAAANR